MHSFITDDTAFNYNPDLSGDVEIVRTSDETKIVVPGVDLLEFVAEVVRNRRIETLEDATYEEVLGARFPGV